MNHARLFTDHDYWTMHDGDEIRFNLEDYQPYEPAELSVRGVSVL